MDSFRFRDRLKLKLLFGFWSELGLRLGLQLGLGFHLNMLKIMVSLENTWTINILSPEVCS